MSSKPDSEVSHRKFADRLDRQANDGHGWDKVPDMLREAAKRIRALDRGMPGEWGVSPADRDKEEHA